MTHMVRCKIGYDQMLDLIRQLKIVFQLEKDNDEELRKAVFFVLCDYLEVDS